METAVEQSPGICDGCYIVQNVVFMDISSHSLTRVTQEFGKGNLFLNRLCKSRKPHLFIFLSSE